MAVRAKHFEYWINLDEGGSSADGRPRARRGRPRRASPARRPRSLLAVEPRLLRPPERRRGARLRVRVGNRHSPRRGRPLRLHRDRVPDGGRHRRRARRRQAEALLESAEWGCFVGASLSPAPRYKWRVNGWRRMSAVALDVEAVRARFSALQRPRVLRRTGGDADAGRGDRRDRRVLARVEREQRRSLRDQSPDGRADRRVAGRSRPLPRLRAGRDDLRAEHDQSQLHLTRTLGRELRGGDEVVVTRLDHDANVSPWLELAHDIGIVVRSRTSTSPTSSRNSERTRVVAFPAGRRTPSGQLVDAKRICRLAHDAGALAWVDAVHYAPHGPIDVALSAPMSCSARHKAYGRTWGSRLSVATCFSAGVHTRCARRPATRPGRCSTSSWPASSPR